VKKRETLFPVYPLAIIGDLNLSLLQVLNILYGVILGASPLQSGLIGAGYGSTYVIMAALLGRLGDKMPRRHSILLALSFQIGVSLYYLFIASTIIHLIIGQVILGCAYGFFWPSIEAHISENTGNSDHLHQKAISNFCVSWSIGYMMGPLLAGIFSDYDVKLGFLVILCFYVIGIVFVLGLMSPQKFSNKELIAGEKKESPSNREEYSPKDGFLLRILFGMFIYAMLGKIVLVYFADYASRSEGLALSGTIVGLILFAYGIGRTLYFIVSRKIESSLKRLNFSYLIIGILLFSLIFLTQPIFLFAIILFFGIFTGLIYKSALELLLKQEQDAKGAKAGLFEGSIGLGSAFSPFLAGILGEILLILPYIIFGIIALAIFMLNLALERKNKKE